MNGGGWTWTAMMWRARECSGWDRISYLTVDYKVRVRVWLSNSQQVQPMVITHMMMAMLMITASVSDTSLTPSKIHVWWLWCKDALSKTRAGMLSGGSVKVLHVLSSTKSSTTSSKCKNSIYRSFDTLKLSATCLHKHKFQWSPINNIAAQQYAVQIH